MSTESDGPSARDEDRERPRRDATGAGKRVDSGRPARGGPARSDGSGRSGRPERAGGSSDRRSSDVSPRRQRQGAGSSGRPDRADRPARADRSDRPDRTGCPAREGRPAHPGDAARPARKGRPNREGHPSRDDRPSRDGRPARAGGRRDEQRLWTRDGRPARGDHDASRRELPVDPDPFNTRSVRTRHDDPPLPDEVTPESLDRIARNELKTLTAENQEFVARHLAMAARTIDEDPELAHRHATSAARRGGRIGVVRETLAVTAFMTGDFALALRELRTYRRITGREEHLPLMVECERALGRPERALELARSVPRASLPESVQAELAIAMSGARLDLGQLELALTELEIPQLDPSTAYSFSPALFDAYATVLEDLGRVQEAAAWFRRADIAGAALQQAEGGQDDLIEVFEEELALAQEEADDAGALLAAVAEQYGARPDDQPEEDDRRETAVAADEAEHADEGR